MGGAAASLKNARDTGLSARLNSNSVPLGMLAHSKRFSKPSTPALHTIRKSYQNKLLQVLSIRHNTLHRDFKKFRTS